jgi:hypothetical protein
MARVARLGTVAAVIVAVAACSGGTTSTPTTVAPSSTVEGAADAAVQAQLAPVVRSVSKSALKVNGNTFGDLTSALEPTDSSTFSSGIVAQGDYTQGLNANVTNSSRKLTTGPVLVGSGVSVVPANGWVVASQKADNVLLAPSASGALMQVLDVKVKSGDAASLTASFLDKALPSVVTDLAADQPVNSTGSLKSNITSWAVTPFEGSIGATPIQGYVLVAVRKDKLVAIQVAFFAPGSYSQWKDALLKMNSSVVASL